MLGTHTTTSLSDRLTTYLSRFRVGQRLEMYDAAAAILDFDLSESVRSLPMEQRDIESESAQPTETEYNPFRAKIQVLQSLNGDYESHRFRTWLQQEEPTLDGRTPLSFWCSARNQEELFQFLRAARRSDYLRGFENW